MTQATLARIADALEKGEVRLDFIRKAVERELKRREAKGKKLLTQLPSENSSHGIPNTHPWED